MTTRLDLVSTLKEEIERLRALPPGSRDITGRWVDDVLWDLEYTLLVAQAGHIAEPNS